MTAKEAKILARLNARKNRSAIQLPPSSLLPDGSSVSKPEALEVAAQLTSIKPEDVLLDGQQVGTENKSIGKKLKRKNQALDTEDGGTTVVNEADIVNKEPAIKRPKREKKKVDKTVVSTDGQEEVKPIKSKKKKKGPKAPKKQPVVEEDVTETTEDVTETTEDVKSEPEFVEPTGEGFTVMEEVKVDKNQKTFRILPDWLAKPSVISCDLSNNKIPIKEVKGLDKLLLEKLKINKIHHLFPGTYFS